MTKFVGNSITFPKISAAPPSPVSGDTYYDTTFNKPFTYNGTEWVDLTLTSATTGATGYWGSFWSTQDQTAALANTAYNITFNNTDADSSGVSIVSNSRMTFAYSGVYSIIYSIQFINTSNDTQDTNVWLKKNGSNVADSDSKWSVLGRHGSVDGHAIGSVNYVLKFTAGDYLELAWQTDSTAVSLEYVSAVSPAPAIPSVILTATQVMNTQQVELTNSTSTTSSTIAASATAVKSAYDLAASKLANISAGPGISVSGSGDSRQVSLEAFAGSSSSGAPGTSFVKSLSSDVYGRLISYENGSVQNASTTAAGIVQLSDSISTTSSTIASTPTAVKSAYDLASGKVSKSGDTITGTLAISSTADDAMTVAGGIKLATGGNDNAIYVGDDTIIFDADISDTMGIKGQQNSANGAIAFGSSKDTNIYRGGANLLQTDDAFQAGSYIRSGMAAQRYNNGGTATDTTGVGTGYSDVPSHTVTFTPSYVGQRWLISFVGSCTTNNATAQYVIYQVFVDGGNLFYVRTYNPATGINYSTNVSGSDIYTSVGTTAVVCKVGVRMQSSTNVTVSTYYGRLNAVPLP